MRACAVAVALVLIAMLGQASSAPADAGLEIMLPSDPVEGLPAAIGARGTTPTSGTYDLVVAVRPAGGSCGPSYPDAGASTDEFDLLQTVSGNFDASDSTRQLTAGDKLACAWLSDQSNSNTVNTSQSSFSVREPHYTLQLIAPKHQRVSFIFGARRLATYRARVFAEEPGTLLVEIQGSGVHRCAKTAQGSKPGDGSSPFDRRKLKAGLHSYKGKAQLFQRGRFLVCGWIEDPLGHTDLVGHTKVTVHG
jgi:hypothetical protein